MASGAGPRPTPTGVRSAGSSTLDTDHSSLAREAAFVLIVVLMLVAFGVTAALS